MKTIRTFQVGLLLIASCIAASAGVMQCVNSTNELIQLNPRTISTNTFVVSDSGVIGSGSAYIWTYDSASSATQDGNHLKPLNYNGRWIRDSFGVGGIPPPPPSPTDLWQESSGAYSPRLPEQVLYATNIVSDQSLLVTGSFGYTITTNITLADSAVNNLTAYRQGIVQLNSPDTDPLVVQIQLSSGQFMGQRLLLENMVTGTGFSLLNGSPLWDDGSLNVVLQYGSWVSSTEGDSLELMWTQKGWREIARLPGAVTVVQGDHLWNMTNGVMYTVPQVVTNGWEFREGGVAQLTVLTNGGWTNVGGSFTPDGYLHIHGPTFSEVQLDGATLGSMIDLYNDDGQSYIHFQSPLNTFMRTAILEPTQAENSPGSSSPYWFSSVNTYTNNPIFALYNGTNAALLQIPTLSFGPDPRITWGAGTNVLFLRDSTTEKHLAYTNYDAAGAWFELANAPTEFTRIGALGHDAHFQADIGGAIYLTPNGGGTDGDIVINNTAIQPDKDNQKDVGNASSSGAFKDSYFKGKQHMIDSNDGAGNFSWVKCFVTNGVAVFDFENGGSGTAPTKFSFMNNHVEVGHFP